MPYPVLVVYVVVVAAGEGLTVEPDPIYLKIWPTTASLLFQKLLDLLIGQSHLESPLLLDVSQKSLPLKVDIANYSAKKLRTVHSLSFSYGLPSSCLARDKP